jgi:hypothetical protein
MTPDELQRLAREAGLLPRQEQAPGIDGAVGYWIALARFAALVRAQALEDAANVCGQIDDIDPGLVWGERCAAAIRALKDKP